MLERIFWRLLPDVRRRERPRFLFFLALFFLITTAETIGLTASESLFLARVGIEALPLTFVLASMFAVLGSFVYAAAVDRFRNDQLFLVLLLIGAAALAAAAVGLWQGRVWIFPALLCLYYLYRAVFVNHYWTFAGDHFDTPSSKRLFPLFAIGASLGGVLGGTLAATVGRAFGAEWLIAVWILMLLAAGGLVRAQSGRSRRWIPLEEMEADDTSVEGMLGAARYLRRSSLGRWLVASCAGMVVALFLSQYVYSGIFADAFPDAGQLAVFFGAYLAVANLVEVAIEGAATPWLIRRFGVPTSNLIHPVITLASFLGLALSQRVPLAVMARANRELLENALASPLRNLTYNALALRYRGRVRAYLDGIVVHAGMAAAGILLLLTGRRMSLLGICLLGAGASLVYAFANFRVRREYLETLMAELRSGRLDLREVEGEIGSREAASLAEFWNSVVRDDDRPISRVVVPIARMLARHGLTEPLLDALSHPHPPIRRASLDALIESAGEVLGEALGRGLDDADPEIRCVALGALRSQPERVGRFRFEERVRSCLASVHPNVRAAAAAVLGDSGRDTLRSMLDGDDPQARAAALRCLPEDQVRIALDRIEDPVPEVRASALNRLAQSPRAGQVASEAFASSLRHSEARVRTAAVRLLSARNDPAEATALAERLADPSREVRRLASQALGRLGETGLRLARPRLSSDLQGEAQASIDVLAGLGTSSALDSLRAEFRERVIRTWGAILALQHIPRSGPVEVRFLRLAYEDASARHWRAAFALLERLENPGVVRRLEKTLRFASSRPRGDALEVLSHLGDREGARLLVLLLEEGPLEERSTRAASLARAPRDLGEVLEAADRFGRWARMAAAAHDPDAHGIAGLEVSMERLLLLRRVPLFSHMSLEQLEAIDDLMTEEQYLEGEVVCREGEPGDRLFVLLDGEVDVKKRAGEPGEIHLATLPAGSYFGEIAILDNSPRSATVIVSKSANLLSLRGDRLKELLLDMPEISFEIFRVLTGRIRTAESRLEAERATGSGSGDSAAPVGGRGSR